MGNNHSHEATLWPVRNLRGEGGSNLANSKSFLTFGQWCNLLSLLIFWGFKYFEPFFSNGELSTAPHSSQNVSFLLNCSCCLLSQLPPIFNFHFTSSPSSTMSIPIRWFPYTSLVHTSTMDQNFHYVRYNHSNDTQLNMVNCIWPLCYSDIASRPLSVVTCTSLLHQQDF